MPFEVGDFIAELGKGTVKASKWEVTIPLPAYVGGQGESRSMTLLARTGASPNFTLGTIETFFRGIQVKTPGDRTHEPCTFTFIDTNEFQRGRFERWQEGIKGSVSNLNSQPPSEYRSDISIRVLNDNDEPLHEWILVGAWPQDIPQTDMDAGAQDTLAEYTVVMDYYYPTSPNTK